MLELIKNNFHENYIEKIFTYYNKLNFKNKNTDISDNFFYNSGNYHNRTDKFIGKPINDYFKNILYCPNIFVLIHVLENMNLFKDKLFIDNGCGIGLLSIFLKHLGLTCYNYDNYIQLDNINFNPQNLELYKDVMIPSSIPPNNISDFKVLISCGIWVDNEILINNTYDYLFLDMYNFGPHANNCKLNLKNYTLIKNYNDILLVFKQKDI